MWLKKTCTGSLQGFSYREKKTQLCYVPVECYSIVNEQPTPLVRVGWRYRMHVNPIHKRLIFAMSLSQSSSNNYENSLSSRPHTSHGAIYNGSILQLNCDSLAADFHQKPAKAKQNWPLKSVALFGARENAKKKKHA